MENPSTDIRRPECFDGDVPERTLAIITDEDRASRLESEDGQVTAPRQAV